MRQQRDAELDLLLGRLADGDRAAFDAVFERLQQPILRLCMGMLKNDADARDAAQQAMEKIFERASTYDRTRPALPWACAIAAWECRTILRKRSRRREVFGSADSESCDDTRENALQQRDLVQAALGALGELSEPDQRTLIATFMDEAPDVSGASFRKRRQRALERLRTSFRRLYGLD